jgi:hypothetical protein
LRLRGSSVARKRAMVARPIRLPSVAVGMSAALIVAATTDISRSVRSRARVSVGAVLRCR